jgi:antitoxin component of MazEF toxin-antitoxin module
MGVYRRVYKQGNSWVVGLPEYILQALKVQNGGYIRMKLLGNKVVRLEPVTSGEVEQDRYANCGKSLRLEDSLEDGEGGWAYEEPSGRPPTLPENIERREIKRP